MKNHKEQFPKIRFHTYCDEWRQYKLGEVFKQTVEYVDPYEQNLELWSVTVESGLTPKEERYNREFLVKKSDKFKKLYPEEIVYNPMNITIGAVGFNNVGKEVAVSGYYVTMKIKSKFSNKFFSVWLSCPKAISLYKIYSTGSLIERQRVQFPTLSEIRASFPSFTEQSAIGSLFRTLDDLLASYKENLANYQSLKATMISKMFPKGGQAVPEIRLDGFKGEWECRKLGTIVDIIGGGTPDTNVEEYWNGEINWFSPTEVGNSIYLDSSEKKISELGLQKSSAKILPANRTILFTSRAGIGSVGIITKDSTTNQGFQSLVIKQGIDIYFLYTYSSEIKRYSLKHSAGSTFLEISGRELGKMDIVIPSYEEQQAIGDYFAKLDQLITSYQEKITQLESLKKKLLQDMFI